MTCAIPITVPVLDCSKSHNSYAPDPPPSLIHTTASNDHHTRRRSYSREDLISLAQTPASRPPAPSRLNSFSVILRKASIDPEEWGVDEAVSSILDGKPISIPLVTSNNNDNDTVTGNRISRSSSIDIDLSDKGDCMFHFDSAPRPGPVLVDFMDPFEPSWIRNRRRTSSTALSKGNDQSSLVSASLLSNGGGTRSRGSSISSSISSGGLNPFAPPFPLPSSVYAAHNAPEAHSQIGNLPLPKNLLPSSLPKRPPGPIAPVFVKRETAALPQPMSLPEVAPLGKDWEGEGSLSGNDRRRRASELGLPALPLSLESIAARHAGDGSMLSRTSSTESMRGYGAEKTSKGGETMQRPERLVKLGERLRQSIAERGVKAK